MKDQKRHKEGGNHNDNHDLYFNPDFSRCVRLLCLQGKKKNKKIEQGTTKQAGRDGRVAQTCREAETLVELAHCNRKLSNLLLITARPLLHRPSRHRGGQRHCQVLPALPSDDNSSHTQQAWISIPVRCTVTHTCLNVTIRRIKNTQTWQTKTSVNTNALILRAFIHWQSTVYCE